jgi:hypothetical protein
MENYRPINGSGVRHPSLAAVPASFFPSFVALISLDLFIGLCQWSWYRWY